MSEHTHRNEFPFDGKLNGTFLHQKLSISLEPTGSNSGCFHDRVKAFYEISYPTQVDKNQKCVSVRVENQLIRKQGSFKSTYKETRKL